MIFLTGVSGRVGGEAARHLLRRGLPVRGLARNPERVAHLQAAGMEVVQGDLSQPEHLVSALNGMDRALLVTPNTRAQLEWEAGFIEAAVQAGVRHLVKLSSSEVAPEITAPFPRAHYRSEQLIRASGMDWTLLRPDYFLQNFLLSAPGIARGNVFQLPFGDTTVATLDSRDVGEAAAVVLEGAGHAGQVYRLTGPELLSFYDIAERFSLALGRPIEYASVPADDFRQFMSTVLNNSWHVEALMELFALIRDEPVTSLSPDLENLLGRVPRSVGDFVRDHRSVFDP